MIFSVMQESSFLSMLGTDTGDWMDKYPNIYEWRSTSTFDQTAFSKESDRIVSYSTGFYIYSAAGTVYCIADTIAA